MVEERGQRGRYGTTHPSTEAKNRFGQRVDATQRAPVAVTGRGLPAVAVMSVHDDEQMSAAVWNYLFETMARAREGSGGA